MGIKPRNHVVLAAMKRASGHGAHGKTHKALRKQEKQSWVCYTNVANIRKADELFAYKGDY